MSVDAFAGVKPTDTLRAGQAIGEDELLQEEPIFQFTAVTAEPVELMEIDRRDFDRILKADRTTERGQLTVHRTPHPKPKHDEDPPPHATSRAEAFA